MEITKEMRDRAAKASSAEVLKKIAAEYKISLSDEEAEKLLAFTRDGELSDEELEGVAGGKGGAKKPVPKYHTGQKLWIGYPSTKNYLGIEVLWVEFYVDDPDAGWRYYCRNDYGIEESYYLDTHHYVKTYKPKEWEDDRLFR